MRGDGAIVNDDLGFAHQLVAVLHVAGKLGHRVHHPEFGESEIDFAVVPGGEKTFEVEAQWAAIEDFLLRLGFVGEIGTAEQRGDACHQVRQRNVFGEVVIGTEAQARDHIKIRIARGEKDDRQSGRLCAQFTAQCEAAIGLIAQANVDDGQLWQALFERVRRFRARGIGRDVVAVLLDRVGVVGANRGVVFDEGNAFGHVNSG